MELAYTKAVSIASQAGFKELGTYRPEGFKLMYSTWISSGGMIQIYSINDGKQSEIKFVDSTQDLVVQ